MFSRFFIDRPIFATVISVVITLAGFVAVWTLPVAQYPEVTPPTVQVTALYPGANAKTVQDTVAAPIEAQVSGVEGMLYMNSRCTNDGSYNLTVTFRLGMDSDMAQVLVQNRVSLALPVIPPLVQNEGISVKKMSPNTLMIVNLVSPDKRYDSIFLSNYATIYVKDELGRVPGVAGITYLGQRDYSLRAWLDPDKMAALNLSGMDVVAAIAQQNVQVAAGQIGQPPTTRAQQFQLTINTQGRLTDPSQFADIIVKAGKNVAGQTTQIGGATMAAQPATLSQGGQSGVGGQATSIVKLRHLVRQNKYFMRIRLDLAELERRGLQPGEVAAALKPAPHAISVDQEDQPANAATLSWLAIYTGTQPPHVEEVANTVVAVGPPARSLRLGDLVAKDRGIEHLQTKDEEGVQLGSQQYDQSCTLDGKPSVALSIYQLPGSNALETANGVYAKMRELKARFPDGLDYKIAYDTTPFIRESVDEVFNTLRDAVILVAIVVLLFLQDWRAMILPMIDVPVSLIGTFAVMAAMGFTLNNLTLFGLVLAIGIVVDDAIVVLENIERQMATGLSARDATIKAMEEITGPILAITLVLSAVFIPCCFLGGITGQFFRQFAVTIAVSTIISAINAITMTPSRAVLIFKTEEVSGTAANGTTSEASRTSEVSAAPLATHPSPVTTHQLKREALPWWIFGLLGLVTLWLGPDLIGRPLNLPPLTRAEDGTILPTWQAWLIRALYFAPGMLVGLVIGWFVIGPINFALGRFFRAFNQAFDRMTDYYGVSVGKVLRVSIIVCIAYGGLLVLTGVQFVRAPTGFIPQQDKGYLLLTIQLPDAASVDRTEKVTGYIEKIVRGDETAPERFPGIPGVAHTVGVSGQSLILNANAPNLASMYIMLDEFDKRHAAEQSADVIGAEVEQILREGGHFLTQQSFDTLRAREMPDTALKKLEPLRGKLFSTSKFQEKIAGQFNAGERERYETLVMSHAQHQPAVRGAIVSSFGGPPVDGLGTTGGFKIIIEDRGNLGQAQLQRITDRIVARGNRTEGLTGLGHSSRANTPWLYLEIDRVKCMTLGVGISDVFNTLQVYLGSYYVNNFNEFGRTWQVNVQADQKFRNKVSDILQLQVRNYQGQMVRLGTFMDVRDTAGPVIVLSYNMYSATAITGNTTPGTSSGEAIQMMQEICDTELPRSMAYEWTELTYLQLEAGNKAMFVFALAVMFVFLVLAAQYESWSLPLAVILVVPMCLLCSVSGVIMAKMEVNIFTQIGFVVLVGLASKNAILIVEFAKVRREEGEDARRATLEASRLRLRPILMTSFAFILGVVPLVLAAGAGAEMRRSLGLAVFAGMCGVTLFGIFLTPVFYYVIQWVAGSESGVSGQESGVSSHGSGVS
jgi:multidrug efflux pump